MREEVGGRGEREKGSEETSAGRMAARRAAGELCEMCGEYPIAFELPKLARFGGGFGYLCQRCRYKVRKEQKRMQRRILPGRALG